MKFEEIKNLTVEELRKKAVEMKEELFQLKMKNELGQVGNPLQIRLTRKDLARVNTALTQKLAQ